MIKVACDEEDVENEVKENVELLQVCEKYRISPLDVLFGLRNLSLALVKADKSDTAISMLSRLLDLWEVCFFVLFCFVCLFQELPCSSPSLIFTGKPPWWKSFWRLVSSLRVA